MSVHGVVQFDLVERTISKAIYILKRMLFDRIVQAGFVKNAWCLYLLNIYGSSVR